MYDLTNSEIFDLTLVVGTYLVALGLYKKTKISLLHPLITSILVIILVLNALDIPYESFRRGSHLIHFLLGPSVVALGYVLFEQIKYLKGNVVSILTSVFVGAIVGIVSVIIIGKADVNELLKMGVELYVQQTPTQKRVDITSPLR